MAKVQSQLLVSEATRLRADALAIVLDTARAEVFRMALEGAGLAGLEATYATRLEVLDAIADAMGLTRDVLVGRMVDDKLKLKDVEGKRRYPSKRS